MAFLHNWCDPVHSMGDRVRGEQQNKREPQAPAVPGVPPLVAFAAMARPYVTLTGLSLRHGSARLQPSAIGADRTGRRH